MSKTVYTLSIPSSTHHLEKVRKFVEQRALEHGLNENAAAEIRVAVDEACSNIIEHAYEGDEEQEIEIAILVEDDQFTVRIRDRGLPFRPDRYRDPDIQQLIRRRRGGGLGVYLMRKLMDNVEYHSRGPVNEVRLIKYLNGT